MTEKDAQKHLGLNGKNLTTDAVNKAFAERNSRCLKLIRFPPPGTDRAKLTQDLVALKEARDTLLTSCVSGPSGTSRQKSMGKTKSSPKAASKSPKPKTPSASAKSKSNRASGSTPQAAPKNVTSAQNVSPAVHSQTPTSQTWYRHIAQWFRVRYNLSTWRTFTLALARNISVEVRNTATSVRNVAHSYRFNNSQKLLLYTFHVVTGLARILITLAHGLATSWYGLPIAAVLSFLVAWNLLAGSNDVESLYKVYSFPACSVYQNGEYIGEAPSKNVMGVHRGPHEIRFRADGYPDISETYSFEKNAYYVFQVDFEERRVERTQHELKDLFTQ